MIAIVNVSKNVSPIGWQDYEVRINNRVITTFQHKREYGLAKCLELASKAVDKKNWEDVETFLEDR